MNYIQYFNILSRINPYVDAVAGDILCAVWQERTTNDDIITNKTN
jgi:hypothetical protein